MVKKISELTAASALGGTEEVPVVQSAATVKSTPNAFATLAFSTTMPLIPTSGAKLNVKVATTEKTAMVGTSVTASSLIPAGSIPLAITTYVTTLITGATGYQIGDGVSPARWGHKTAVAAGTTTSNADWLDGTIQCFAAANDVVLTSIGADFTAGAVRIVVHYIDSTAPTS